MGDHDASFLSQSTAGQVSIRQSCLVGYGNFINLRNEYQIIFLVLDTRGIKGGGAVSRPIPTQKNSHLCLTQVWTTRLWLSYRWQYIRSLSTLRYRTTSSAGAAIWVDHVALYHEFRRIGELVSAIFFLPRIWSRPERQFFLRLPAM